VNLSELMDLLSAMADSPGEKDGLSELDHGLQCAHELAAVRPDDLELQIAGLCHDIGHQFGPDEEHGRLGAQQVRALLGERVASLVEAHVPAKRYLVYSEGSYGSELSEASTISLMVQGGPMTVEEALAFESEPWWRDAVTLRRADESAKVAGRLVPGLDTWIPVLEEIAR
jgi:predicted HD phosphohydrolase